MSARSVLILTLPLVFVACGESPLPHTTLVFEPQVMAAEVAGSETERLNAWFDEKNEERLRFSPLELTALGRKELYDRIDDFSSHGREVYLTWFGASVDELKRSFAYDKLDFEAKTSYDLWIYTYENAAANAEFERQEYLLTQMSGVHIDLPTALINYHRVDTAPDMLAYVSRIEATARAIGQVLARVQDHAADGVRAPRFAYEAVISESGKLIAGRPFEPQASMDAPVFADGEAKIQALVEKGEITESEAESLGTALERTLLDEFAPAYRQLIAWFQNDLPNSPTDTVGATELPGGAAYYRQALANYTTLPLSAEEVHTTGLREVERIKTEMGALKERLGFDGNMEAFNDFIRSDDRFFYPNNDVGRQAYLDDSSAYIDDITEKLPEYFGILPKAPLVVRRVEPYREQDGAPQHYMTGSIDGSRPGTYYVHLANTRSMPKTEMEAVAYHEGIPGHHLQLSIAQEQTTLPDFRGQMTYTAYTEGWALYAEQLAAEMGAYEDPYLRYGQLTSEMWRAIRLVVDTGMHAMDWSEQHAIEYFAANATTPLPAITAEVRRYLVWPGQATAYKTGMLKILELRERAESRLGDSFDIREFHDVVLGGGSLPLSILEKRVENWLDEKRDPTA